MPYISSVNYKLEKTHPFPYNIPAIKYAKNIDLSKSINIIVGENGTGKSTFLETLAYRLQLPLMHGGYHGKGFEAVKKLIKYLEVEYNIFRTRGFFFRAEDFGNLVNASDMRDRELHESISEIEGEVPDVIIQEMKDSQNFQLHNMRMKYGQDLQSFSHGEAYLHIMQQQVVDKGIYLLDEPEAALSPARQLALITFIRNHLHKHQSQFIIATHCPILMSYPEANIYEVDDEGMSKSSLADLEHYSITKNFLNNPDSFLRFL